MNIIKHGISLVAPNAVLEYQSSIGNRIIYKEKNKACIFIVVNGEHYIRWGLSFIGIALLSVIGILTNIKNFNWFILFVVGLVTLPFLAVGINYIRKARSKTLLKFDHLKKEIVLNDTYRLSYSKVKSFTISLLDSSKDGDNYEAYQLNLLYGNKELVLINADSYKSILYAAEFLSKETEIHLRRDIIENIR